jgi:urease accessory protein
VSAAAGLLLADARFPAGGHAHSGAVEAAVTAGLVADLSSLETFLLGRLRTAGLMAAGLAAAACARASGFVPAADDRPADDSVTGDPPADDAGDAAGLAGIMAATGGQAPGGGWARLDAEADARTPAPAQREASRRQGRAMLRAARAAWPEATWLNDLGRQPHHPVIMGATAAAAGCSPVEAARVAAYQVVAGSASAAVRLLGLDPLRAAAILARLADQLDEVATVAAAFADGPLEDLPCPSAPALDLLAQAHTRAEARLFES